MAKLIKVDVLRNICLFKDGKNCIIRKGKDAELTGEEYEHYLDIGAVKRAKKAKKVDEAPTAEPSLEGGDA